MRKISLSILLFVILSLAAFGQSLTEGSTIGLQVEPNPLNNSSVYDFELCCGIPAPPGGFLGNGYGYNGGQFNLFFKQPQATVGYSVTGTFNTWDPQQIISKDCYVQNGTLTAVSVTFGTKLVASGDVAEYSQLFCQRDGVYWVGPGGLSVHQQ